MAELKDPLADYTIEQLYAMPPEQQNQLYLQYQEYLRRKNEEQQAQIDEANKPNTATQNAVGAVAGPAATIGGYYAANALFGGGAAAGAPAAPVILAVNSVPAAGAAGATGASAAGAAGAAEAATAGTTTATTGGTGAALGTAASYAWPLAAAYGAYRAYDKITNDLKESDGGPLTDSELFYGIQPTGAAAFADKITGGLYSDMWNAGVGPLGPIPLVLQGILGTTKEENQVYRDRVRKDLKKRGFLNDNYEITTPGGAYNIGIEGNNQFKDGAKPRFAGEHRYDVDVASLDQAGNNLYGIADALANAGVMGDEKRRQQFAGYFMNAANVGGDPFANMQSIASQLGLDYNQAMTNLNQRTDLTPEQRAQYQNGINMLFKQDKYSDQNFFNQAYGGTTGAKAPAAPSASQSKPEPESPKATALEQALSQIGQQQQQQSNGQTFAGGRGVTKGGGPLILGSGNRPQASQLAKAPPGGMNPNPSLGQVMPQVAQQIAQQQGQSIGAGTPVQTSPQPDMVALAAALRGRQWNQQQHQWQRPQGQGMPSNAQWTMLPKR